MRQDSQHNLYLVSPSVCRLRNFLLDFTARSATLENRTPMPANGQMHTRQDRYINHKRKFVDIMHVSNLTADES